MNITDDLSRGFSHPLCGWGERTCSTQEYKALGSFKHLTLVTFVRYVIYVQSCENLLISFLVSHLNLCVWLHKIARAGLQKRDPEKADSFGVNSTQLALTPGRGLEL